jgi:hypothetical protein
MREVLKSDLPAYNALVETHKKLVQNNIHKFRDNKRILSKYLWLRKYHNAVIRAKLERDKQATYYVEMPDTISRIRSLTPGLDRH